MTPPPPSVGSERKKEGKHDYAQEVSPGPPERKDEEDGEDNAGDLARVGVEPARDERRADQARTEVARREREPGYAAGHDRRAALIRCSKPFVSVERGYGRWKWEKKNTHDRARRSECVRM
jgi:hypothetical protein